MCQLTIFKEVNGTDMSVSFYLLDEMKKDKFTTREDVPKRCYLSGIIKTMRKMPLVDAITAFSMYKEVKLSMQSKRFTENWCDISDNQLSYYTEFERCGASINVSGIEYTGNLIVSVCVEPEARELSLNFQTGNNTSMFVQTIPLSDYCNIRFN
jgi:hypothetical protein